MAGRGRAGTTSGAAARGDGRRGLVRLGAWAVAASAGINAVLFVLGDAMGAFPPDALIPRQDGPLTLGPVLVLSVLGPVIGLLLYAGLRKLLGARAWPAFLVIAGVVLVAMAIPPFQIAAVPVSQIVILQVMHVVTAAATLWAAAESRG